jgi:uncharacterized membrane protein
MRNPQELISTLLVFIFGIYLISELIKIFNVNIAGVAFGPLLLAVFIVVGFISFMQGALR